jgi:hypothetical protein
MECPQPQTLTFSAHIFGVSRILNPIVIFFYNLKYYIGAPASQPADQQAGKPASQQAGKPASKPASQQASQRAGQPAS